MPGVVHTFADINPVTLVVNAARALTIGHGHALAPTLGTLAWLTALLLIFVPLSVRAFRRAWSNRKPAISKHLRVLEETGVVTRVVEGRTHRLSPERDVLSVAADWMDQPYLDLTALGRQEQCEDSPEGYPQTATR